MHRYVVLALLGIASGCAVGSFGASGGDEGAHGGAGATDASAPASDGGATSHDGAAIDAAIGADGASASDSGGGTDASAAHDSAGSIDASAATDSGLDPLLDLPDASGAPCSTPGSENGCPAIEVCRIASVDGGRCEGCSNCGNLGSPCSASSDCDILFQCYSGKCSNICPLGSSYCGAVSDCLNVGNLSYGVCR